LYYSCILLNTLQTKYFTNKTENLQQQIKVFLSICSGLIHINFVWQTCCTSCAMWCLWKNKEVQKPINLVGPRCSHYKKHFYLLTFPSCLSQSL